MPGGAQGVRLAAVDPAAVERFRTDGTPFAPSLIVQCSPLVARFIELEPLQTLLGLAVEAGEPLRDGLWNEVRPPAVHLPDSVRTLAAALDEAWREAEQTPVACDDFFVGEILRVVQVFAHAAAGNHAVVNAILPVLEGELGDEIILFHV